MLSMNNEVHNIEENNDNNLVFSNKLEKHKN